MESQKRVRITREGCAITSHWYCAITSHHRDRPIEILRLATAQTKDTGTTSTALDQYIEVGCWTHLASRFCTKWNTVYPAHSVARRGPTAGRGAFGIRLKNIMQQKYLSSVQLQVSHQVKDKRYIHPHTNREKWKCAVSKFVPKITQFRPSYFLPEMQQNKL